MVQVQIPCGRKVIFASNKIKPCTPGRYLPECRVVVVCPGQICAANLSTRN